MASNVNFKDYLNQQLQGPQFKQEFENETTKLESAVALTHVRKEAGLTQRELATYLKCHNLQLRESKPVQTLVLIL